MRASEVFPDKRATEAQLRRLYAVALAHLVGTKREKLTQLARAAERRYGLEWDALDADGSPNLWMRQSQYEALVEGIENGTLEVME